MKIYTYYENINFKNQDELVALWEKSWKQHDFEPIVLMRKDAEKSDFYEEFVSRITELHQNIAKNPLSKYGLSCWLRWLAYSTQPEEKFFVSDYDVINHKFNLTEPIDTLHLMDDCCPCIASGTSSQFLALCKKFIEVTEQNKQTFIDIYKQRNFVHFHDQEFFQLYYQDGNKIKDRDIKLTRNRELVSGPHRDQFWKKPVIHYSHHACECYCEQNNIEYNHSGNRERCNIIKQYINK
jgi:hypothetical protein